MNYLRISFGIFLILAASRFIPHPPNFTSLLALSFYVPAILGRKFLPALHSLISIIILLIIVPSYAESVSHYPESIGYFLALLGIIFGITNSESNDDIFKNIFLFKHKFWHNLNLLL